MSGPTVLVADDHLVLQKLFTEFLESFGYRVVVAASAVEVLDVMRTERVDAVLLDLRMPGEFGGDAVVGAVSAKAPVIVVTAVADDGMERRLMDEGAFAFVQKPVNLMHLLDTLRGALAHRRAAPAT